MIGLLEVFIHFVMEIVLHVLAELDHESELLMKLALGLCALGTSVLCARQAWLKWRAHPMWFAVLFIIAVIGSVFAFGDIVYTIVKKELYIGSGHKSAIVIPIILFLVAWIRLRDLKLAAETLPISTADITTESSRIGTVANDESTGENDDIVVTQDAKNWYSACIIPLRLEKMDRGISTVYFVTGTEGSLDLLFSLYTFCHVRL